MKWKVPFTRTPPKPGLAHIVIAYKTETGQRAEFDGQVAVPFAHRLMEMACSNGEATAPDSAGDTKGESE